MFTDGKYQTHGVGSKMLDFLLFYSEGLEANYNTIGLEVNKKNKTIVRKNACILLCNVL